MRDSAGPYLYGDIQEKKEEIIWKKKTFSELRFTWVAQFMRVPGYTIEKNPF